MGHIKEVTIYALTDPDSGEVRYVGQTSAHVWTRYGAHLNGAQGPRAIVAVARFHAETEI